jgi:hypothetical protein
MGTTIAFFQSPGIALLFIVISSSLARYACYVSQLEFFSADPCHRHGYLTRKFKEKLTDFCRGGIPE